MIILVEYLYMWLVDYNVMNCLLSAGILSEASSSTNWLSSVILPIKGIKKGMNILFSFFK